MRTRMMAMWLEHAGLATIAERAAVRALGLQSACYDRDEWLRQAAIFSGEAKLACMYMRISDAVR